MGAFPAPAERANGTSAPDIHRNSASSQMAFGYLIGVDACSPVAAIARRTAASTLVVTEKQGPAPAGGSHHPWPGS